MANLLKVTKEDNEQFSFVLNGDSLTEIINTRNDLLTFGNETHWKTSNGANLIKEQNVIYSNVSLFNGVTPIAAPTSVRDLFDKLTALGYFDWMLGGGGGGVNRFTDLLDTFEYFGKAGQFVVVSDDELQLISKAITIVTESTELIDMPAFLIPNKMLQVNELGTGYIFVDPPTGSNSYSQPFIYLDTDPQEFTLASSAKVSSVFVDGGFVDPVDWSQTGNVLTILPTYILSNNARVIATGVI